MNIKYACLNLIFFLLAILVKGQDALSIGILSPQKPSLIQVIPEVEMYNVLIDGASVLSVNPKERVSFKAIGKMVQVSAPSRGVIGQYASVKLVSASNSAVFRLYVLSPSKGERVYDDHLHITAEASVLQLINRVDIEKYVAGVVEAETGKEKGLEFYKVQAIISRTYALSNRKRYLHMGFNLNDQVDCQVYHGKSRWEPDIVEAVKYTAGMVLVDSEMRLITAAFHSNSGGETVSSETVWTGALPYLIPRRDEFSLNGAHYKWEKTIHKTSWLEYLADKYGFKSADPTLMQMATNYEQEYRQIFFIDPIFNIPLKDIRKDWGLNSTFFDIAETGDSLRITGRGFGHGTGLSQEGAMRMADLGFEYSDILHFYYNDVHIIDLRALGFFKE